MTKRKIIKIDQEKCTGCGLCIPNCPEGALQIIDGKVRLVSDLFCDGLGACIGHCPEGAITVEEREAQPYAEKKVMENIVTQGGNVIKAHLCHLKEHNAMEYLKQAVDVLTEKGIEMPALEEIPERQEQHPPAGCACPGSQVMELTRKGKSGKQNKTAERKESQLRNWPVQLMLVPPQAAYLKGAHLLLTADCVPFAYPDFHETLLKNKVLLIGCPKLDNAEFYQEKLTRIIQNNGLQSITCAHMEAPCCFGLVNIAQEALKLSGKDVPFKEVTIGNMIPPKT